MTDANGDEEQEEITGPPPPRVTALATVGLLASLLLFWVWWFDRNREPRQPGSWSPAMNRHFGTQIECDNVVVPVCC